MNCQKYESEMLDLLHAPADANGAPLGHGEAARHVAGCAPCLTEFQSLRSTFAALDSFPAPEPSPWFDAKLAARIREAQSQPEGFFERLRSRLLFSSNLQLRPVLAGSLALVLAVSGGSFATLMHREQQKAAVQTSATLDDLQRLDNDEPTLQQVDQLLDDEVDNGPSHT
jgi:anti-sigma factor RsiW